MQRAIRRQVRPARGDNSVSYSLLRTERGLKGLLSRGALTEEVTVAGALSLVARSVQLVACSLSLVACRLSLVACSL